MLRYRRYRVFIVFAIFIIGVLYRFTTVKEWEAATSSSVEKLKEYAGQSYKGKPLDPVSRESLAVAIKTVESLKAEPTHPVHKVEAALPQPTPKPVGEWELGLKTTPIKKVADKATPAQTTSTSPSPGRNFELSGEGRVDAPPPLRDHPVIHWEKLPEHFPVPKERILSLPTGTPISIPKIQYAFKDETPTEKSDRESKQARIKAAFEHSWKGYKDHAWLHDELKPVSGDNRDPFCGWAATLVDALDTLWVMDLKDDFENATKALEEIDFTTTTRRDIPMFETTIRYLGGLVAAYDVSGAKYKIILEKAQQLGDILLSAFDTPNRMPITYYNWRPTFAKNPHRAGTRTVLAELGSLSMEFTRLAQLTGEHKYYDAIARITNELELMQSKTRIPGLWPEKIDTSGCLKPPSPPSENALRQQDISKQARIAGQNRGPISPQGYTKEHPYKKLESKDPETEPLVKPINSNAKSHGLAKRQLNADAADIKDVPKGIEASVPNVPDSKIEKIPTNSPAVEEDTLSGKPALPNGQLPPMPESDRSKIESGQSIPREKIDCIAQALTSPPHMWSETFRFGGASDSTYEYLPKMHLLTGGLVPQYAKMYEKAIDAANEHLLYRPMIPEADRKLLVVGNAEVREGWPEYPDNLTLSYEQSHLLCFTGGMWGIGSKIFKRDKDLEIAKQITDGCVWSYENMATGIMPESFYMLPCPSQKECAWNETLWKETLDPNWRDREEQRLIAQQEAQESMAAQDATDAETRDTDNTTPPRLGTAEEDTESEIAKQPTEGPLAKREVDTDQTTTTTTEPVLATPVLQTAEETPTWNPWPTHEEYVEQRISEGRLPKGVPRFGGRHYILRPEAIESVFIMYRMTGDNYWREKGWKMWEAIERETKAEYGHSAIRDVTRKDWEYNKNDEMESFWLAETLKYFYLLFSTPDVVSLDEWVLNTEAHPFKRPK